MNPPSVEQFLSAVIQEPVDDEQYELKKWQATNFLRARSRELQEMVMDQSLSKDVRLRAAQCSNTIRWELRP